MYFNISMKTENLYINKSLATFENMFGLHIINTVVVIWHLVKQESKKNPFCHLLTLRVPNL